MKNLKYRPVYAAALMCLMLLAAGGCADNTDADTQEALESITPANIYDSEDAAVVVQKDTEAGTIRLQNIATSKRYTLNYSGTTAAYNKYGEAISMQQLKEGSVVTVRFYKSTKALSYIQENTDAFSFLALSGYELDLQNGKITVGGTAYTMSSSVVVVSDGAETEPWELNAVDVISMWGYQDRIYGINVEKGHGYLRLQNEDYFVGGWIDVGDKVVKKIEEDMLLVVPEGTYSAMVSNNGSSATQEITFARNEEMLWDLGDVEITVVQTGKVIFTLTPVTAAVTIDGAAVDTSQPVELEYGIHSMRVSADGYDTVAQYIKVAEPSASVNVELEESSGEETQDETLTDADKEGGQENGEEPPEGEESPDGEEPPEESQAQSGTDAVASSSGYRVYIDAPEDVEVYVDGSYIGIAPVDFAKKEGSYVVTLRKTGCQTRSYTLQIDGEEKDVNYSFAELLELDE
ncbi:MAG: PEGA domain-containing protein [Lachnospiraceae bacterium]|nr:PEGA domain-containing protein [Lachnospiraceae bacterium]